MSKPMIPTARLEALHVALDRIRVAPGMTVPEETLPELWERIQGELALKRRALTEEEIRGCVDAARS